MQLGAYLTPPAPNTVEGSLPVAVGFTADLILSCSCCRKLIRVLAASLAFGGAFSKVLLGLVGLV